MNDHERLVAVADAAADVFRRHSLFQDSRISILTERQGDISATIARALSQLGLSIAVLVPDVDLDEDASELKLSVRVTTEISELAIVNQGEKGSRISALAAATACLKAIHRAPNGLDTDPDRHRKGLNEFHLPPDRPMQLVPDKRYIVYHVTAYTSVTL